MPIRRASGYWIWVGGPVAPGAAATTLGPLVLIREQAAGNAELLRHEEEHVAQWRRHGTLGFAARYLSSYLRWRAEGYGHWAAYRRVPYEIEAAWVARRQFRAGRTPG